MTQNKNGFTFVEAVVVAVIMGILAAVAIPVYTAYIENTMKDNARADMQLIGAAAMQAHNRGTDIDANDWGDLGITDPSDEQWSYTFQALAPGANADNWTVTAEDESGRFGGANGTYTPNAAAGNRWGGILDED
jgi:prepilin-type N-terminal cleavage/methylation domain-containing protein